MNPDNIRHVSFRTDLPEEDICVPVKLADGTVEEGKLIVNQYSETVWKLEDGRVALICDPDGDIEILTKPDMDPPLGWFDLDSDIF